MKGIALRYDVLIVGAGFAGSVLAERFAASGRRILIIDKRPHIGGNAYDHLDQAGVLVHRYGPYIFHTNSQRIVDYLGRFPAGARTSTEFLRALTMRYSQFRSTGLRSTVSLMSL